ncbi:MAG: ATP synthase F0 subunit C [Bdellovibrionales bacterium]|nr:ATP synthase F0 subunit C [Bdellovibrionales bacterium]
MKKMNLALLAAALAPAAAMAEEVGAAAAGNHAAGAGYMAAGLCMGLAAAVVGFSQSRAAVAALEGISRNPSATKNIQTPLILSLALMESLVLFAFVVAFTLAGK